MKIARVVRSRVEAEAARLGIHTEFGAGGRHLTLVLDGKKRIPFSSRPTTGHDNQADWLCQNLRRYARGVR